MLVDDAHLLDDGSAALVHQLVQEKTCSLVELLRWCRLAARHGSQLLKVSIHRHGIGKLVLCGGVRRRVCECLV